MSGRNRALVISVMFTYTRVLSAPVHQNYSYLPTSDYPSNLIRCQVYHEPRHHAHINCARLCQIMGCYMFGVEDGHCAICPQCPTDSLIPLGPTPPLTMYKIGRFHKDVSAVMLLHHDQTLVSFSLNSIFALHQ